MTEMTSIIERLRENTKRNILYDVNKTTMMYLTDILLCTLFHISTSFVRRLGAVLRNRGLNLGQSCRSARTLGRDGDN